MNRGTNSVVNVGANDEALLSALDAMADSDDITRLDIFVFVGGHG